MINNAITSKSSIFSIFVFNKAKIKALFHIIIIFLLNIVFTGLYLGFQVIGKALTSFDELIIRMNWGIYPLMFNKFENANFEIGSNIWYYGTYIKIFIFLLYLYLLSVLFQYIHRLTKRYWPTYLMMIIMIITIGSINFWYNEKTKNVLSGYIFNSEKFQYHTQGSIIPDKYLINSDWLNYQDEYITKKGNKMFCRKSRSYAKTAFFFGSENSKEGVGYKREAIVCGNTYYLLDRTGYGQKDPNGIHTRWIYNELKVYGPFF